MGQEIIRVIEQLGREKGIEKQVLIEAVEAASERIERVNPILNAVVTPMYDYARQKASDPMPDGPFAGVPFLLKDFLA